MIKLNRQITKISASMIFIAAILTSAPSLAESATLNGVEISSSGEKGYDIVLNTDTKTNVQTKEATSDKLVLDLKNTKVAKDANTVYKNADGIENVILKPKANNLEIEINGEQAGESKVSLNSETEEKPQKDYSNTVFVNLPMHSYAPVTDTETETAGESGLIWLLRSIKNSQTLRSLLSSGNLGWILCFALMFGFLVVTNLKNRPQKRVNVKISSNEPKDIDNTLLKQALARKEGLIAEGLGSQQTQPRRTQITQQPRTIQQQPSIQKQNYGLRAYNNQQLPVNNTGFKIQSTPLQRDVLSAATGANRQPVRTTTTTATKQQLREDVRKNEVRIDNVKFLESMAKIYERSGRSDLASGLANNIKRAKNIR